MAREIGRLEAYGIGIESTAGTAGAVDVWIPIESGKLRSVVETVKDVSGRGVIDGMIDANTTKRMAEFTAQGVVRAKSIGYLLLMAFGQVATPALLETGVYSHVFSRKNDNNHPTGTIYVKQGNGDEQSVYHMLDSFSITGEVGQYMKFDMKSTGQSSTTATGLSVAYTTADETFLVSKAYIKFANDLAGLAAASRTGVKSFKFEVGKNAEQVFETRTGSVDDAYDFTSQHNKNLVVSGDFEAIYDDNTFKGYNDAATTRAIELTVEGKFLIGATKYNALTFRVAQAVIEDWDRSDSNDDIVTQSFGFTGLYSVGDGKTFDATLVNTVSTIYS